MTVTDNCIVEMQDSFLNALMMLEEIIPRTNQMTYPDFGAFFCMMLEEWCVTHNEDVTKIIQDFSKIIVEVNKNYGAYQKPSLS